MAVDDLDFAGVPRPKFEADTPRPVHRHRPGASQRRSYRFALDEEGGRAPSSLLAHWPDRPTSDGEPVAFGALSEPQRGELTARVTAQRQSHTASRTPAPRPPSRPACSAWRPTSWSMIRLRSGANPADRSGATSTARRGEPRRSGRPGPSFETMRRARRRRRRFPGWRGLWRTRRPVSRASKSPGPMACPGRAARLRRAAFDHLRALGPAAASIRRCGRAGALADDTRGSGRVMRWPWTRPERRAESLDYAATIADAFEAAAAGTSPSRAANAVAAAAAGCWSRAFAVGMPTPATPAVTPAVLACIGRELILRGEIVFDIRMSGASLALIPVPASNWEVEGRGPDPATWRYRVYPNGPSGTTVAMRPAAGVVHAVYSVDPARPWEGVSPIRRARLSAALASSLETRLSEEAGASTGRVLPFPDTGADAGDAAGPLATLRADLAALKGKTALVPSRATGWGEGRAGAPRGIQAIRSLERCTGRQGRRGRTGAQARYAGPGVRLVRLDGRRRRVQGAGVPGIDRGRHGHRRGGRGGGIGGLIWREPPSVRIAKRSCSTRSIIHRRGAAASGSAGDGLRPPARTTASEVM